MAHKEKGLTLSDRKMLEMASNGKTGEEIGAALGISGERAVLRIRDILKSRDVWDDVEREKLLLNSIYELKEKLEQKFDRLMEDPKNIEQYRKTLELLGQTLERRTQLNDSDLEKITAAQGLRLLQLIEAGYNRAKRLLAAEYPDVDLSIIDQAFIAGMDAERVQIESAE